MKRATIPSLFPVFLLMAVPPPPDTPDKKPDTPDLIMREMVKLFEDTAKVLEGVKAEKDVKPAEEKLKKLVKKAEKLQTRAKKVKDPSKEEQEKLMKKYMPKILAAGLKMQKEAERITPIDSGKKLATQVQNIGKALGGSGKK